MKTGLVDISVRGKAVTVPAMQIDGRTVVVTGKWIKIATIHGEGWLEGEVLGDPAAFVAKLKGPNPVADLFTFSQKLPETEPKYNYYIEWENVAAIRTDSFKDWWENRLPQETRKNVRRAGRRNVVVRTVEFDDALIRSLKEIYDETPVRQGRRFWHYGKDFTIVKSDNSSYLERSELIGAYHQDELIALLKMVYVNKTASVMQIVAKNAHADKRPMNALIAKAVEICEKKGLSFFVYGQYIYGSNSAGQLTEFKRRNGFEQFLLPRYYVPLTPKGRFILKLQLHRGLRPLLPGWLEGVLLELRGKYYEKTLMREKSQRLPAYPLKRDTSANEQGWWRPRS